jgi:hypothetical protein
MGHKHQVHYGLNAAFKRNPERFVRKEPQPPAKPIEPWINPPQKKLNIQA